MQSQASRNTTGGSLGLSLRQKTPDVVERQRGIRRSVRMRGKKDVLTTAFRTKMERFLNAIDEVFVEPILFGEQAKASE
jgi:hypothetical protein